MQSTMPDLTFVNTFFLLFLQEPVNLQIRLQHVDPRLTENSKCTSGGAVTYNLLNLVF